MSNRAEESLSTVPQRRTHPPYIEMVMEAIRHLQNPRGSSRAAILQYIIRFNDVGRATKPVNTFLKRAIKRAIDLGYITQVSGMGACGSFKLAHEELHIPTYNWTIVGFDAMQLKMTFRKIKTEIIDEQPMADAMQAEGEENEPATAAQAQEGNAQGDQPTANEMQGNLPAIGGQGNRRVGTRRLGTRRPGNGRQGNRRAGSNGRQGNRRAGSNGRQGNRAANGPRRFNGQRRTARKGLLVGWAHCFRPCL